MVERIYVSHSAQRADGSVSWFIVEPIGHPEPEVARLIEAGRTVYELEPKLSGGVLVRARPVWSWRPWT